MCPTCLPDCTEEDTGKEGEGNHACTVDEKQHWGGRRGERGGGEGEEGEGRKRRERKRKSVGTSG